MKLIGYQYTRGGKLLHLWFLNQDNKVNQVFLDDSFNQFNSLSKEGVEEFDVEENTEIITHHLKLKHEQL